ncbi:uncharacterized protein [Primulina huaijiensis]|uniref:uncharacterized protein isoform X1 n=1 Tax=Primulina huaijiensis TaxID=1492673 RepID=UPI003CC7202D
MVAGLQGVKSKYTSLGDGSYIIKLIVGAVTGLCYWPIFVSASFSSVLTVYRIHKPWFFQSSVFCLILIATYGGPLYLRGPWGALSPIPENNAMTVDCQLLVILMLIAGMCLGTMINDVKLRRFSKGTQTIYTAFLRAS